MISSIRNYFYRLRSKQEREQRFPELPFTIHPMTMRSVGLSTDELSPKHIYEIIAKYYETLDNSNHRYEWLRCWLPIIENELNDLNKYTMENVGRIVIIQNERAVFDFYIICDIHIEDQDRVIINLDHDLHESSYVSNTILSLSMLFSAGSLGYLLSNLF